MKRVMCLHMPLLSTDRLRKQERDASEQIAMRERALSRDATSPFDQGDSFSHGEVSVLDQPIATIAPSAQALRIVCADALALREGVRPGQTLAEAKAMVPQLVTFDHDAAADRAFLEDLAACALDLAPIVHIEDDRTLILDVTGCERLYGSDEVLAQKAVQTCESRGASVRVAIADSLGASWALAHAHPNPVALTPPGQTVAHLVSLPVWSLRIEQSITDKLAKLGVTNIGALLHLPRSSLTSRFGEQLLERIDQALGDLPEAFNPFAPEPELSVPMHFGCASNDLSLFTEAARRVLETFCDQLTQKVCGVCHAFVTFYMPAQHQDDIPRRRTIPLELSRPTRSARHLMRLLEARLGELRLPAPADGLCVWTKRLEPLDDWQAELFDLEPEGDRALDDLVDRLSVRLGRDRVVRALPVSDHQPERAFRYVPALDVKPRDITKAEAEVVRGVDTAAQIAATDRFIPSRPLRLLPVPRPLETSALTPGGAPIAVRLFGAHQSVVTCTGPERIETGWWRGPHIRRDYYRVVTGKGRRLWIFRERGADDWFLHGWFE